MGTQSLDEALAQGYVESVRVNQRGLIDKILARYSGEFVVYRELFQNADDALATSIQINFESSREERTKPISKRLITTCTVKNDGIAFRDEDWTRLIEIANGQPNTDRIGAFGVGWYSLFSICEEPMVASGDGLMKFFWQGEQLAVRRARNPLADSDKTPEGKPWTTITMLLRELAPMPNPAEFARFVTTALTFTSTVKDIEVALDGQTLCSVSKATFSPKSITHKLANISPLRFLTAKNVEQMPLHIKARVMRQVVKSAEPIVSKILNSNQARNATNFASKFLGTALGFGSKEKQSLVTKEVVQSLPREDDFAMLDASLFLRIVTTNLNVNPPRAFVTEIERAIKKPPPKTTQVSIIFASQQEYEAGTSSLQPGESDARKVFETLLPVLGKQGRVFIGFATHQSTGNTASVSARFIPTVERESLDLVNRHVADYNRELLWASGFTARAIYDDEIKHIESEWANLVKADTDRQDSRFMTLKAQAAHIMQYFSASQSTPAVSVGQLFEDAFFGCSSKPLSVITTNGVLSADKARTFSAELVPFIQQIPFTVTDAERDAKQMFTKLRSLGFLLDASFEDVIGELANRALSAEEAIACLKWWITLTNNPAYDRSILPRFYDTLVFTVSDGELESVYQLKNFKTLAQPKIIPPDLSWPTHTLPLSIAKAIPYNDLVRVFGFRDLTILEWVQHLVSKDTSSHFDTSITQNEAFADHALSTIGRNWLNLSMAAQRSVVEILRSIACIPTRQGFKPGTESYFPNVNLFEDLAIVKLHTGKVAMDKFLEALGVRKHVDLALVFSKMLGGAIWSQEEVTKYLVSVQSNFSAEEQSRLRSTRWLVQEGASIHDKPLRHKASHLYEPNEELRQLGLPIIAWKDAKKWRSNSDEARLLFGLGLNQFPPLNEILRLASSQIQDELRRTLALSYFLRNFRQFYRSTYSKAVDVRFIPSRINQSGLLESPSSCYENPDCAILNFPTISLPIELASFQHHLEIQSNPSGQALLSRLVSQSLTNQGQAVAVFAYMASQISQISNSQFTDLRNTAFIPVWTNEQAKLYKPCDIFLASSDRNLVEDAFQSVFVKVDFGDAGNIFLQRCGVRVEPTTVDVANMLIADPSKFLSLAGSPERYRTLLRQLAANSNTFDNLLWKRLANSPFIIGSRRIPSITSPATEDDDGEIMHEYELLLPAQVLIVEDQSHLSAFGEHFWACPQEDDIELFAMKLGSRNLSKAIAVQYEATTDNMRETGRSLDVHRTLLERLPLFLHERRQRDTTSAKYHFDAIKAHLAVKEVPHIKQTKTLVFAKVSHTVVSAVSALADEQRGSVILLRLSSNLEIDYFDISVAICKVIFKKQTLDDAMLLMSFCQTSLQNLKRRGFNVDRILNARRLERESEQQKLRELRAQAEIEALQDQPVQPPLKEPLTDRQQHQLTKSSSNPPPPLQESQGLLNKFIKSWKPSMPPATSSLSTTGENEIPGSFPGIATAKPKASLPAPPTSQVTPMNNITNNVLRAIQTSRAADEGPVKSSGSFKEIKEAESSYCDESLSTDLVFVADVASLRFYVSAGLNSSEVLSTHGAALQRYVNKIVKPVGQVFDLAPKTLHIFYDQAGPVIAFNRSGALFLNLRYYIAWHDVKVQQGDLTDALISCYFSLSHELAHNLVQPHNSEHEFYFSSISETYLTRLAKLL